MDTFEPIAEEVKREKVDECLSLLESRRGEVPDDQVDEAKNTFLNQAKQLDTDARRKVYELKLRLIRVESSIIIVGTLIWAFGDWMVAGAPVECIR